MPRVPFVRAVESVLLGGQDLGPPFYWQIPFGFKLLLFPLQTLCSGYESLPKANLFHWVFRYAELVIVDAYLVFGGGCIVVPLQVSHRGLYGLLDGRLIRTVFLFGTIWIISGTGVDVAGLGVASMTHTFCFAP